MNPNNFDMVVAAAKMQLFENAIVSQALRMHDLQHVPWYKRPFIRFTLWRTMRAAAKVMLQRLESGQLKISLPMAQPAGAPGEAKSKPEPLIN